MTVSRKMTKILTCKPREPSPNANLLEQNFFFATYLTFRDSLNQCLSRKYTAVGTLRRLFVPYIGTTLWMASLFRKIRF